MTEKMRICSPELGLDPNSNLGGEVHDREILKAIAQQGIKVEIILPFGKKHEDISNWHVTSLPFPFIYPPWLFNFLIIPYLFAKPIKILRVQSPYYVGIGALIFKFFKPRVKTIATYHHLQKDFLFKVIDKFIANKFDAIVTVSDSSKNEIIKSLKVSAVKIFVVPNGINDRYQPNKRNSSEKILLYLGQLVARKNVSFLLAVLSRLPNDYILYIVGDGEEQTNLQNEAKKFHLTDRVIFTGKVSEDEKLKYYHRASIFLYPSTAEGFGMSILEAMACGNVVIASKLSVFNELIVSGKNGFLIDLNEDEWAKTIKKVLENKSLRENITKNAITKSHQYSWDKSAKKYLAVIKSLL